MNKFTKFHTKTEVADLLGITTTTLRKWLNVRYFDELKELGYYRNQKKLSPKQLNYLHEKLNLTPEK